MKQIIFYFNKIQMIFFSNLFFNNGKATVFQNSPEITPEDIPPCANS